MCHIATFNVDYSFHFILIKVSSIFFKNKYSWASLLSLFTKSSAHQIKMTTGDIARTVVHKVMFSLNW